MTDWKLCSNCGTDLEGATTCPNCGWQVPQQHQTSKVKSGFWTAVGFWALMVGVLGGCGFLIYTGLGSVGGFGPLGDSGWARWIGIAVVALYVVMSIGRAMRRK